MKTTNPRRARRSAFTLLEVLLVLAILAVIGAIVVPNLLGRQKEAYVRTTKTSIKNLEGALTLYAQRKDGEYPPGGQDEMIAALTQKDPNDQASQPILDRKPLDAWNQVLFYTYPGTKQPNGRDLPDIWSSGPNKTNEDGGGDDINNWTEAAAS